MKKDIDDHKDKWLSSLTRLEDVFEHSTPRKLEPGFVEDLIKLKLELWDTLK